MPIIRTPFKKTVFALALAISVLASLGIEARPKKDLSVVASLTVYADIAKEIVGERG